MAHDKKAEGGAATLVLTRGIGLAFVQKNAPLNAVEAMLTEELATAS
jgi:3-dehydroquinate synthase